MAKNVCVLGSGLVSSSVIKNLCLAQVHEEVSIVVGSKLSNELRALQEKYPKIRTVQLDVTTDFSELHEIISNSNIVISLLTNEMHVPIAKKCIELGVHMVHASYCTEEMKQLDFQARTNGVTILNEIGLDPGIDHFLAKKMIDEIQAQEGAKIKSFVSYCGGLPEPKISKCNPLRYKFSWSPRTALGNMLNPARYLEDDKLIVIPAGGGLIQEIQDFHFFSGLELEGYPNRDSLAYKDLYELSHVSNIVRGTLRYKGYGKAVKVLFKLDLLNADKDNLKLLEFRKKHEAMKQPLDWTELIKHLAGEGGDVPFGDCAESVEKFLRKRGFDNDEIKILEELGLLSGELSLGETLLDTLAEYLALRLAYKSDERDVVILKHIIRFEKGDREEVHEVDFIAYGDQHVGGFSAMSKTVGLTIAHAAQLLLNGIIQKRGVIYPFSSDIYEPLLRHLKDHGLEAVFRKIK